MWRGVPSLGDRIQGDPQRRCRQQTSPPAARLPRVAAVRSAPGADWREVKWRHQYLDSDSGNRGNTTILPCDHFDFESAFT